MAFSLCCTCPFNCRAVRQVEGQRIGLADADMVDALPEDGPIECRDAQDLCRYPLQLAFFEARTLEVLLRVGASPADAQAAIRQRFSSVPIGRATLLADDARRKWRIPGIRTACHISLHPGPLLIFVFIGPAVLLCRRYPVPCDDPAVLQMEFHHFVFRDDNLINLVEKYLFIKGTQTKHCSTLLFKDLLWDTSFGITVSSFCLVGSASPAF